MTIDRLLNIAHNEQVPYSFYYYDTVTNEQHLITQGKMGGTLFAGSAACNGRVLFTGGEEPLVEFIGMKESKNIVYYDTSRNSDPILQGDPFYGYMSLSAGGDNTMALCKEPESFIIIFLCFYRFCVCNRE